LRHFSLRQETVEDRNLRSDTDRPARFIHRRSRSSVVTVPPAMQFVRPAAEEIPYQPFAGNLNEMVSAAYEFNPDWAKLEAGLRALNRERCRCCASAIATANRDAGR